MKNVINIQSKRAGEPDTLHLMLDGIIAGSAVWHSNSQEYRVRIGAASFWEPDAECARKALLAGKSTTQQILEQIGVQK